MKRAITFFTLFALLFVGIASVASAGGWAVVTLDSMPTNLVVNEPVKIGMMIRQHGKTPWVYNNVRVRGFHSTGETFATRAEMDERGHYSATLKFSRAGQWQWAVASGLAPEWQTMPELQVADSAQAEVLLAKAANAKPAPDSFETMLPFMSLLALGVLGLVGTFGGFVFWLRTGK